MGSEGRRQKVLEWQEDSPKFAQKLRNLVMSHQVMPLQSKRGRQLASLAIVVVVILAVVDIVAVVAFVVEAVVAGIGAGTGVGVSICVVVVVGVGVEVGDGLGDVAPKTAMSTQLRNSSPHPLADVWLTFVCAKLLLQVPQKFPHQVLASQPSDLMWSK
mmetsp:Transcript_91763/g.201175  ORF Transcript_91763/g.201175 Transcript_91763/m.201175 type:complete len:159 (-) Transcript_91763:718-1194(-)